MPNSPRPGRANSARPGRGLRFWVVGLTLLVPLASGCATKRDFRDLRADLDARDQRVAEQMAEITRAIGTVADTVARLSAGQDEARAEVVRELISLQDQLIQVQELTGQNQRTLTLLRDQNESRRTALDRAGDASGGPGTMPPSQFGRDVDEAYETALSAYNDGSLTAARRGFEAFVQRYAQHERAPDAQFYLADIQEQAGEMDEALEGFLRVRELHPTSDRVPDALYRAGMIELGRGDPDAARRYFQRVVQSYPDSDAARFAQERLSEIG